MTGLWIPIDILEMKELSFLEKGIYSQIIALSSDTGICYASNSHFASLFGCTSEFVSRTISKLSKKNLLTTEIDKSNLNSRKIIPQKINSVPTPIIEPLPVPPVPQEKPIPQKKQLTLDYPADFSEKTKELFAQFVEMRTKIKKPIKTQNSIDLHFKNLEKYTDEVRIKAITESVKNEYQGIFPEKHVNDGNRRTHKHNTPTGVQPSTSGGFGNARQLLDAKRRESISANRDSPPNKT